MLDRRQFVAGSCCAAAALRCLPAIAQTGPLPGEFICGTVDRAPVGETAMRIDRYSVDAGFDRAVVESLVRDFKITPFGTAFFGDRWRRGDGLTPNTGVITLGVHFLTGSQDQKAMIQKAASDWLRGELGRIMKFKFDVPRNQAQIVIDSKSDRNDSIVGREGAKYAQSQVTMNLADLVDHIVQHEFGHAIGLEHEHQHPGASIQWNKPAVVADMARQGWTAQMVEDNIFARFGKTYECVGDTAFNPKSIMLYPIPSRWTLDGFSSGTNAEISNRDRRCVEVIYRA